LNKLLVIVIYITISCKVSSEALHYF